MHKWYSRRARLSPKKARHYTDQRVVAEIIKRALGGSRKSTFSPTEFESSLGIDTVPDTRLSSSRIEKHINPSVTRRRIHGNTLSEQLDPLLPENPPKSLSEQEFKTLGYCFKRFAYGNLPDDPLWLWSSEALTPFSASVFTLHIISTLTGKRLPWLEILHLPQNYDLPVTQLERPVVGPDSPEVYGNEYLTRVRGGIRSLSFDILAKVCRALANKTTPFPRLTGKIVSDITGHGQRRGTTLAYCLDLLMTERAIPIMSDLGLRYRYAFVSNPAGGRVKQDVWDAVQSPGLCQLLDVPCLEKSLPGLDAVHDYQYVLVNLEPVHSSGPETLNEDWRQVTVDIDSVSMRMDLFDRGEGEWTTYESDEQSVSKDWLFREAKPKENGITDLSFRSVELFSILWAHTGSAASRKKLIEMMEYPRQTIILAFSHLFDNGLMTTLYHPDLEYAGLPDMVLVALIDAPPRRVKAAYDWFNMRFPFVLQRMSTSGRDLVAHIRVPLLWGGMALTVIREHLDNTVKVPSIVGVVRRERTMFMTAPLRLLDTSENTWNDPWVTVE